MRTIDALAATAADRVVHPELVLVGQAGYVGASGAPEVAGAAGLAQIVSDRMTPGTKSFS